MKRFFVWYWFILLLSATSMAQGEIDQQEKILYRNEKSLSLALTSTGWAINARYAKRINAARKIIYDADFAILKHPKEVRLSNDYSLGNFVFGKRNIVMDLRVGYGNQLEIFRKFDIGGVSIRHFHSVGASIALLKPVYYEYYFGNQVKTLRFDKNISAGMERASFFKGLDEINIVPGLFFRVGMCFEYSQSDRVVHAIEAGVVFDAFPKELEMMANTDNSWFFTSLFISYRFGKVFDPSEKKAAKKKNRKKEDYYY